MIFNSLEFLFFLPVVAVLYFSLAARFRWLLLLASSYCFYYYWNNWYLVLILVSTLIDYWAGIKIDESNSKRRKWFFLQWSILLNLGLLFYFKYFNFFNAQIAIVAEWFGIPFTPASHDLTLPLGISFYTFQTMSYSIDVYKGRLKAERHLGRYALYVSFFAQLAAGPIERAGRLLKQFHGQHQFEYKRIREGLQLILWGFFKKIVIADRLSRYVQEVYQNPEAYQGPSIWIATWFFVFQIFCDFSAYSDIAIGTARILGINLSLNFGHSPYFSTSFTQFWEKWHITLTTWVRDYLYMPLARRYRKPWQRPWLWFFVFLIIGLWHGANWTFVVWGGLNGLYLVIENKLQVYPVMRSIGVPSIIRKIIYAILIFNLTAFSAVFFIADSIGDAFTLLGQSMIWSSDSIFLYGEVSFLANLFFLLFMELMHFKMKDVQIYQYLGKKNWLQRWAFYFFTVYAILFFGLPGQVEFIYFDF